MGARGCNRLIIGIVHSGAACHGAGLPTARASISMGRQSCRRSKYQVRVQHSILFFRDHKTCCGLPVRLIDRGVLQRRIFSSERGPEGKRVFIATTLKGFWNRYRDMLPRHRHCYEIIRQGYPCHLYFGALAASPCLPNPCMARFIHEPLSAGIKCCEGTF